MSHRVFTTNVIGVTDGKFDEKQRPIHYPDDTHTTGVGKFITKAAFGKYIDDTYADELRRLNEDINDAGVSSKKISFDIGKTTLLMILAQEGCEGVRLILCKNQKGEQTFVVKGISKKRREVKPGVMMAEPVEGFEGADDIMSEEVHGRSLAEVFQFIDKRGEGWVFDTNKFTNLL